MSTPSLLAASIRQAIVEQLDGEDIRSFPGEQAFLDFWSTVVHYDAEDAGVGADHEEETVRQIYREMVVEANQWSLIGALDKRLQAVIPADLWAKHRFHMGGELRSGFMVYGAMARHPDLAPWSSPLRDADNEWYDACLSHAATTRQLFASGKVDEAYAHWRQDPLGGAHSTFASTIQEDWVALMNATHGVQKENTMAPIFGYYINLDERGDFDADVRDEDGKTVYEIKAGASLDSDESSIFDDGFMRNKDDVAGLESYLKDLKVIPSDAEVLSMTDFEQALEARQEAASSLRP